MMIYFSGLDSIIESLYLDEKISDKIGGCDIIVNPEVETYLVRKTIILNSTSYDTSKIERLLKNKCTVISRTSDFEISGVKVYPYLPRPNFHIQWNGDFYDISKGDIECSFDGARNILFFPKLEGPKEEFISDSGELSYLGWAMYQVGQDLKNSQFPDLDILKTKKMRFEGL